MTPVFCGLGTRDKDLSRAWTLSSLCGCEARKETGDGRRERERVEDEQTDGTGQRDSNRGGSPTRKPQPRTASDSSSNKSPYNFQPPGTFNMSGRYTHAVVRGVPSSLAQEADGQVDLARAQRESGVYSGILRQKLGLQVMELPACEDLPRGQLIGDTAVVIADTALITRPAIPARRKETEGLQKLFEELKFRVVELEDENATLDASDILFTGSEIFVGLSKWTNIRGAEIVAKTYQDYAVSTVPVSGDLHLKSFCSMGGPDTLLIGSSDCAKKALKVMEQLTDHHYETLTVPDDPAANCIYARVGPKSNVLVHRSAEEYPNSVQVLQKLTDYTLVPASCTEMSKLGGCLTACSILINRKLEI